MEYEMLESVVPTNVYTSTHVPSFHWEEISHIRSFHSVCKSDETIQIQSKSVCKKYVSRNRNSLAVCIACNLYGHISIMTNSKLHTMPQLSGKSCFEILHSDLCKGLWVTVGNKCIVRTSHPIYNFLLKAYDLDQKKGSRLGIGKD